MRKQKTFKTVLTLLCGALCGASLFAGLSVADLFTAKAETSTSMVCAGASIRVSEDGNSGMRFHVRVASDSTGNVTLDGVKYDKEGLNKLTTGIEITPDGLDPISVKRTGAWTLKNVDGEYFMETQAYVYDIEEYTEENYLDKQFSFRGWYKTNGVKYYTQSQSRSLGYVAMMAKYELDGGNFTGINALYNKILSGNTKLEEQLNSYLPERIHTDNFTSSDYLYRVGNKNEVAIGSLFNFNSMPDEYFGEGKLIEASSSHDVTVTYSNNKFKFNGTGFVTLAVKDDCSKSASLILEVVDGVNATTATSVKTDNVVLLNDVGFSTLEVSNGRTLYGNGFKMEAKNDVMYDTMGVGFIHLDNGTLDNVQVICPNFSYSILYNSNITLPGNEHAKSSDASSDAYGNVRSAVLVDGRCSILNSYISGGRAAVFVRGTTTNLLVENSTIDGGAAANMHITSAQGVTLRGVTLIQEPKPATVHDTSKTVMGFSIANEVNTTTNRGTPITLEGDFVQYAWVHEGYSQYVPSDGKKIISEALKQSGFVHKVDGKDCLNLGMVYISESQKTVTPSVTDNRFYTDTIPYEPVNVNNVTIYSYSNSNGTDETMSTRPSAYVSTLQSEMAVRPIVTYSKSGDGIVYATKYDESNGWHSTLTLDLDKLGTYDFSFEDLVANKFGTDLLYWVQTKDGSTVDKEAVIKLTDTGVAEYVLMIADNVDSEIEHAYPFILTATKSSIPESEIVDTTGGTPLLVVKSKGGDWTCAIPALEGIKVKYYTNSTNAVTLDFATLTPSTTGKPNGTNNYWEIEKDGYKLKVTCGYIHDTKQVYGMPVVVDNSGKKMYFTISDTNGYVSTNTSARTVTLTYEFTDPNGKTLTFSKTWQFNYADYKNGKQYSYSDFVNGKLTEASSSCIVEGTMITLANGTQKKVEDLTYSDVVLAFNHYTGKMEATYIAMLDHLEAEAELREVVNLKFSNGETLRIVWNHGIFDATLNEYVFVNEDNYQDFVGHKFYSAKYVNGEFVNELVTLEKAFVTEEVVRIYNPTTLTHMNYFASGILNVTAAPEVVSGHVNYFELDENMKYDEEKMQADIEKYGLYTYDDFKGLLTEEAFNALPFKYLKVSVGKGLITWDGIMAIIDYMAANGLLQ